MELHASAERVLAALLKISNWDIDQEGDGGLEKDDMQRGGGGFRLLDRNRDGSLSADDFLTGREVSVPRTEVVGCSVPKEMKPGR